MLWLDGRLRAGSVAPFDLTDRGLLLGDGVFDTALALNGRVVFEAAHAARLVAAAAALGFTVQAAQVSQAMRALAEAVPRAAIRTNLTRGSGPRGLAPPARVRPVLWASAVAWVPDLAFAPLRLMPAKASRNETSVTARLKTLSYLDAILEATEARRQGFDECLFLNTKGHVACAGSGNLFALFGRRLITPPLEDGVLDGIVRREILSRIGPEAGLAPEEGSLTLDELRGAEVLLTTNSLRLAAPISAIGERRFGSAEHPAFARIVTAARRRVADQAGLAPEDPW